MGAFVAVPVRLDALLLPADQIVVGAFADFSRLPYNDGSRDVNGDVVNLAESVLAPPFQDAAYPLKAGIHLHWAMVPIRLGEFSQFGDGLVGYWQEAAGTPGPSGDFLSPQSTAAGRPGIRTAADEPAPLVCTPEGPPRTLSLLVDPRGPVHATSGVQPAKELRLPPDQYAPALSTLSVSFRTAPVLAPGGVVNLPLPREPGYRWSWLSAGAAPQPVSYDAGVTFAGPVQLRDGWLTLVPDPAQAATPSPGGASSPAAAAPATGPAPTPAPSSTSTPGAP